MNRLIEYFVNNSFVVNLLTVFIFAVGALSLSTMNRDLIPGFEYQSVMVSVNWPGASAQDVEKNIAYPIEETLKGLTGVEKLRSTSSAGNLYVSIAFSYSIKDMDEAKDLVERRVDAIRYKLPSDIRSLTVTRDKWDSTFLANLVLKGFDSEDETHFMHREKLISQLSSLDGVIDVRPTINDLAVYIKFDQYKLKNYQLSPVAARSKIKSFFQSTPVGFSNEDENMISLTIESPEVDIDVINNIVLRTNLAGQSLKVSDVAEVNIESKDNRVKFFYQGSSADRIRLSKDLFSDSILLKEKLEKKIIEFNKTAAPFEVHKYMDGAYFIEKQLEILKNNGVIGFIIVFLVLLFFFNWKAALMTSLGLPLSYFGAITVMSMLGVNINLLSVAGLLLVLGILVDDAIIVSERYQSNLELGMSPKNAAVTAVQSLIIPVSGSILTTIIAFMPILVLPSQASIFLYSIPVVIISALLVSWYESFFILPNHLKHFVKKEKLKSETLVKRVIKVYESFVKGIIRFRYAVLLVCTLFLVGGFYLGIKKVPQDMGLMISMPYTSVPVILKESADYNQTYELVKMIESEINALNTNDIEKVMVRIGRVWHKGERKDGPRYGALGLFLDSKSKYESEVQDRVQNIIKPILEKFRKNKNIELLGFQKMSDDNEDKYKNAIMVNVAGDDSELLYKIEPTLRKTVLQMSETKSYIEDSNKKQKIWKFLPDVKKLQQYGVSVHDIATHTRGMIMPDLVLETRINGEAINVFTEFEKINFENSNELNSLTISSKLGEQVPITFLGSWKLIDRDINIHHEKGKRILKYKFEFDEKKITRENYIAKVDEQLNALRTKFPQVSFHSKNLVEQETENREWGLKAIALCLFLVLLVIAFILRSMTLPFIVGLPIPFAVAGIFYALFLHDQSLTMMAIVGLLGTIGVAVNASILLIDQVTNYSKFHMSAIESIVKGSSSRLRAISITTFTTLAGTLPMAYSIGGESGYTRPLAFTLAWGLFAATTATLIFIPAILAVRIDLLNLFNLGTETVPSGKRGKEADMREVEKGL